MRWSARLLLSRLRRTANLTLLRLTGLVLAVALAAAIPTFVAASMERVLQEQLQTEQDPLTVVVGWRSADGGSDPDQLAALDRYLRESAGLGGAAFATLPATAQTAVQQLDPEGTPIAGRRFLKLAPLPDGLELVKGRMPATGQAEVVLPDSVLTRYGYAVGSSLRLFFSGERLDVTIVGTVKAPATGPLAHLGGAMESALLTGAEYWASTELASADVTWAAVLPPSALHAADVPALAEALAGLPLRAERMLPGADVLVTPVIRLADFARQMAATQRFLLVLLTPVFVLVLFFVVSTAHVIIDSRRLEIAVLRSRGATPWRVIAHYLPESGLMALLAAAAGLALTPDLVQVMGLTAGFLQLVGRPPMAISLSSQTVLYGLAAALLAEAAALWPLVQTVRYTVATIRQEAVTRSPVIDALRLMLELILLGVLAYGTWQMRQADPLALTLPALLLAGAGLLMLRLFAGLAHLAHRLLAHRLSPALSLALGWLRSQSARYRSLSLMLVITLGLGIYGAAFARTLDRDLTARAQYQVGADLVLQPAWEAEVEEMNSEGEITSMTFREPPYGPFQNLPGASGTARVQTRKEVALSAGNRSLGRADLLGITPQEFGRTARFLPDLTPAPGAALAALALEERAVLISRPLAERTRLKPGDRLKVRQGESEVELIVAGVVAHWPGRLPEQGEFLVANLPYLQDTLGLAPYAVWLRLEPGAAASQALEALGERQVRLTAATDRRSAVAAGRRQPFRLGIYATLSAGFLVAVLVMALTYLLSIGLTLQARAKELGVLRAMGMPPGQVALSLYVEQLLIMGSAAATGLAAGAWAAALYVPVLRQQPGETILPLRLAAIGGDRLSLLIAFTLTLALGVAAVSLWIKRLDVQAVLRLGEDG